MGEAVTSEIESSSDAGTELDCRSKTATTRLLTGQSSSSPLNKAGNSATAGQGRHKSSKGFFSDFRHKNRPGPHRRSGSGGTRGGNGGRSSHHSGGYRSVSRDCLLQQDPAWGIRLHSGGGGSLRSMTPASLRSGSLPSDLPYFSHASLPFNEARSGQAPTSQDPQLLHRYMEAQTWLAALMQWNVVQLNAMTLAPPDNNNNPHAMGTTGRSVSATTDAGGAITLLPQYVATTVGTMNATSQPTVAIPPPAGSKAAASREQIPTCSPPRRVTALANQSSPSSMTSSRQSSSRDHSSALKLRRASSGGGCVSASGATDVTAGRDSGVQLTNSCTSGSGCSAGSNNTTDTAPSHHASANAHQEPMMPRVATVTHSSADHAITNHPAATASTSISMPADGLQLSNGKAGGCTSPGPPTPHLHHLSGSNGLLPYANVQYCGHPPLSMNNLNMGGLPVPVPVAGPPASINGMAGGFHPVIPTGGAYYHHHPYPHPHMMPYAFHPLALGGAMGIGGAYGNMFVQGSNPCYPPQSQEAGGAPRKTAGTCSATLSEAASQKPLSSPSPVPSGTLLFERSDGDGSPNAVAVMAAPSVSPSSLPDRQVVKEKPEHNRVRGFHQRQITRGEIECEDAEVRLQQPGKQGISPDDSLGASRSSPREKRLSQQDQSQHIGVDGTLGSSASDAEVEEEEEEEEDFGNESEVDEEERQLVEAQIREFRKKQRRERRQIREFRKKQRRERRKRLLQQGAGSSVKTARSPLLASVNASGATRSDNGSSSSSSSSLASSSVQSSAGDEFCSDDSTMTDELLTVK